MSLRVDLTCSRIRKNAATSPEYLDFFRVSDGLLIPPADIYLLKTETVQ